MWNARPMGRFNDAPPNSACTVLEFVEVCHAFTACAGSQNAAFLARQCLYAPNGYTRQDLDRV